MLGRKLGDGAIIEQVGKRVVGFWGKVFQELQWEGASPGALVRFEVIPEGMG